MVNWKQKILKKQFGLIALGLGFGLSAVDAQETVQEKLERQDLEIKAIREQLGALGDSSSAGSDGWPSWFSLGGEWELEFVDSQADPNQDSSANPHPRFQNDKFVFKPKVKLSKNFYMTGEIELSTSSSRLEEYHAHFTGLPLRSYIQVGFDERFSKADGKFDMANRKTENYPLLGTATWRDEEFAIIWGGKNKLDSGPIKDVFWRISYGDGLELNERQIGENDSYEITHDNDQAADTFKNKKQIGCGLGFTFQPSKNYKFDVAGYFFDADLNSDDIARLASISGYETKENLFQINGRQQRTGIRTTHKVGKTTLTYEAIEAKDARFRRKGYYCQVSHKIGFKRPLVADQFFVSVEPLFRFEEYDTNIAPVFGDAETWDRKQEVYALLVGLTQQKNLKSMLKLEYTVNDERTGAIPGQISQSDDPDNDEFLAQLEIKF